MHRTLGGRGRAAAALALSVALVGASVGCLVAAAEADGPEVVVHRVDPDARPFASRAEVVAAWRAELAEDGRQPPPGWQDWSTDRLRSKLWRELLRDRDPEELDPGMSQRFDPCEGWAVLFSPGCW